MLSCPACPKCKAEVGTPIRNSRGETETDRWDGPADATVFCPACGCGWIASPEALEQAHKALDKYYRKHAPPPARRFGESSGSSLIARRKWRDLPETAQRAAQSAIVETGGRFAVARDQYTKRVLQGKTDVLTMVREDVPRVVCGSEPSRETHAALVAAGWTRCEKTADKRYEWKAVTP